MRFEAASKIPNRSKFAGENEGRLSGSPQNVY